MEFLGVDFTNVCPWAASVKKHERGKDSMLVKQILKFVMH